MNDRPFLVEDFVQALTSQLDRAQDLLALKARTGRPITFALKDLSVDLHVFLQTAPDGRTLMRHAGANESGASAFSFSFTTITKSMAEENSVSTQPDEDTRSLADLSTVAQIDDDTKKQLDWAGVRTVSQLKRVAADPMFFGDRVSQIQRLLEQSARPTVTGHEVVHSPEGPMLRIRGANLTDGVTPEVRLAGEPVEVVRAATNQILVRPQPHHVEGQIEVLVGPHRATGFFRMPQKTGAVL